MIPVFMAVSLMLVKLSTELITPFFLADSFNQCKLPPVVTRDLLNWY